MDRINYNKLFLILRTRDIKGAELIRNNVVSAPTIIKLRRGENVNTAVLIRLCNYLDCKLSDICEYKPDKEPDYDPDVPFI